MNHYHSDGKHLDFVGTGAELPGTLKQVGGQAGIVDPTNDSQAVPSGKMGSVTVRGTVKLDNSGVAFSDGDTVGYAVAGNNAVGAGLGDFDCGTSVGDAGTSDQVVVLLNGQ